MENNDIEEPTVRRTGKGQRIRRMASQVYLPRLIKRDYAFHQSSNRVCVKNENMKQLFPLLFRDWFHVMMRVNWYFSLPFFLLIWFGMIYVFALAYMWIDRKNKKLDCGLAEPGVPIDLATAYAFSLETCTTVGCKFDVSIAI